MKILSKITILTSVALILLSCSNKTYSVANNSSKEFRSHEVFVQKEIPGQEDGKTKTYLHLTYKNESSVKVTAIIFRGREYELKSTENQIKLDLEQYIRLSSKDKIALNEALVKTLTNNQIKYFVIKNIEQKEDLYLP